jgi:hypothetical protein
LQLGGDPVVDFAQEEGQLIVGEDPAIFSVVFDANGQVNKDSDK